jgi:hypothetical protein
MFLYNQKLRGWAFLKNSSGGGGDLQKGTIPQNKETNQKGHSFDVRLSRRQIPAYTRERAAAMVLGSIVREFYYKQYGENRTMIILII